MVMPVEAVLMLPARLPLVLEPPVIIALKMRLIPIALMSLVQHANVLAQPIVTPVVPAVLVKTLHQ